MSTTPKLIIGPKELGQIREIALREFLDAARGFSQPVFRDVLLFQSLKTFLEQKGITCEWDIRE